MVVDDGDGLVEKLVGLEAVLDAGDHVVTSRGYEVVVENCLVSVCLHSSYTTTSESVVK